MVLAELGHFSLHCSLVHRLGKSSSEYGEPNSTAKARNGAEGRTRDPGAEREACQTKDGREQKVEVASSKQHITDSLRVDSRSSRLLVLVSTMRLLIIGAVWIIGSMYCIH